MKFLKEDYGQSIELNNFVRLLDTKYNWYYMVQYIVRDKINNQYFRFKEDAKKYYDNLVKTFSEDKEYYEGSEITLNKVSINKDYDEEESFKVYYNDELKNEEENID